MIFPLNFAGQPEFVAARGQHKVLPVALPVFVLRFTVMN
jgi:hypothetical protein